MVCTEARDMPSNARFLNTFWGFYPQVQPASDHYLPWNCSFAAKCTSPRGLNPLLPPPRAHQMHGTTHGTLQSPCIGRRSTRIKSRGQSGQSVAHATGIPICSRRMCSNADATSRSRQTLHQRAERPAEAIKNGRGCSNTYPLRTRRALQRHGALLTSMERCGASRVQCTPLIPCATLIHSSPGTMSPPPQQHECECLQDFPLHTLARTSDQHATPSTSRHTTKHTPRPSPHGHTSLQAGHLDTRWMCWATHCCICRN